MARGENGFYKKVEGHIGHQINFERGVNVETTSFAKVASHQVIPVAMAMCRFGDVGHSNLHWPKGNLKSPDRQHPNPKDIQRLDFNNVASSHKNMFSRHGLC